MTPGEVILLLLAKIKESTHCGDILDLSKAILNLARAEEIVQNTE